MTLLSLFRSRAAGGNHRFISPKGWRRIAIMSLGSAVMALAAGLGSWYPFSVYAAPAPACPLSPQTGRIIVRFQTEGPNARRIIANGTAEQAALGVPASVPAGTYKITLSSYDFHFRPYGDTDPQEQWYMLLKNQNGGDVAQTGAIGDIGNQEEWKTDIVNQSLVIGQPVVFAVAFHAAFSATQANEAYPICAALDPVGGAPASPAADIKANGSDGPVTIPFNTSVNISWTSTNATSCTVDPDGWTGIAGSRSIGTLTAGRVFTLRCTGPGGDATDSVTVAVQAQQQQSLPEADLGANPFSITRGASSILTWSSQNADSCTAGGAWSGSRGLSGSETVSPQQNATYVLTCTNSRGSASDSVTIAVQAPAVLPVVSIVANPSAIDTGQSSVLTWSSVNADSCTASGNWSGSRAVSGSEIVSPSATATYAITCTNSAGSVQQAATVTVRPTPATAPSVSLVANPAAVNQNGSSVLSWVSHNATTCAASGGWSGWRATSGSETVTPAASTVYSITCTGPGGAAADSKSVTVFPAVQIFAAAVPVAAAQTGTTAAATVSKTARNITLNQQDFSNTIAAQGNDVIEFRVAIRNTSAQAATVTLRDVFPLDLFYVYQSARVDGVAVGDSLPTAGGLVIANVGAGQERIVLFRSGVIANAIERMITNEARVTIDGATLSSFANIQIKKRAPSAAAAGPANVVTGPGDIVPWLSLAAVLAAVVAYAGLFQVRYAGAGGASFGSAFADVRLQFHAWLIRRRERIAAPDAHPAHESL